MKTIPAKTLLSPYRENGWFGSNYTVNLYRGCPHGCIYCDSRSECYGNDDFDTVYLKQDAIRILQKELASKKRKGVVLTGSMGDPYNPFEAKEAATKAMLLLLKRYGFGVAVLTKSDLVMRDADLFSSMRSMVSITITSGSDALAKKIEPHTASSSRRFSALKTLSNQGVLAGVTLMPILPFITDTKENILEVVEKAAQANATWVYAEYPFSVTLRDRQREYFYEKLDENFSGMKNIYQKEFGDKYLCSSDNFELWKIFTDACDEFGLLYKMEDIARLVRKDFSVQSTLF